jgi:16S rRNA (guanine527-N7)-methyltransferase
MTDRLSEVVGRIVPRETQARLTAFVDLLIDENSRQNLIAKNSIPDIWERHILDGAQLVRRVPASANWVDIGSGAGLPGMVIASLVAAPVTLVEPRRLRAAFLAEACKRLGLANVTVLQSTAASLRGQFDVITARAVAPAVELFAMTRHLTHPGTIYVLPKGKSAQSELAEAKRTWQGVFRLEPSLTSAEAAILVASNVRRKGSQ